MMENTIVVIQIRQYFGIFYEWNVYLYNEPENIKKHVIQGSHYCDSEQEAEEEANRVLDHLGNGTRVKNVYIDKDMKLPDWLEEQDE